ncbi:MAG TPA: hypothetical protein VEQ65_00620 [Opitutus sp.]|nr:hypothetical protein [Opitutus sp.]
MRSLPPAPLRLVAVLVAAAPSVLSAHPGHDDPEITWEFSHLVEHPAATLACFAILIGAAWLVRRALARSTQEADQSLRDAQDKAGK